jgi:pimeloyl-ACP methyl ester carboxylesterase
LGGVGLLGLIAWATIYFFPLHWASLSHRYEFWKEGVKEVESAGLHGYFADRCEGTIQKARQCTCVVMIHGLADDAMTWKKILLWPNNGWLKPVKLYAFDLPGTGGSKTPAKPSEDYRVRNQALALQKALAPLCPSWSVVGNSLGGWIAAWLALDWPEGVHRLILADSAGLKSGADPKEVDAFMSPSVESLKEFQRRAYFKGRPLSDSIWAAAARRMKSSNAREVIQAQTAEDFLDGRITTLRTPTLLLWGEADQITPSARGQEFKALMPGAVWQSVPECGHLPQKECPLEVIRAIARMIDFGAA